MAVVRVGEIGGVKVTHHKFRSVKWHCSTFYALMLTEH